MSKLENGIVMVLVLMAPVGWGYGWWFYVARMLGKKLGWRSWVTLAELVLVTVAAVMWPVAHLTAPNVNWQTWVGAGDWYRWVGAWRVSALRILLAAIVTSLFGRPRLILPVVMACAGVGCLWIFSDIP